MKSPTNKFLGPPLAVQARDGASAQALPPELDDEFQDLPPRTGQRISTRLLWHAFRRYWWQALLLWGFGTLALMVLAFGTAAVAVGAEIETAAGTVAGVAVVGAVCASTGAHDHPAISIAPMPRRTLQMLMPFMTASQNPRCASFTLEAVTRLLPRTRC